MNLRACPREKELAALLERGHWPEASSKEMRDHVASCNACRALAAVTQAFRGDRAHAMAQPRLESPGVLWWRAQLRRRNAALERLSRPLFGAQVFAVVLAMVAAGAFLAAQVRQGVSWLADLLHTLHFAALLPASLQDSPGAGLALILLTVFIALAGGVALYVGSDR
jgi:anti-sigma factor RsiW